MIRNRVIGVAALAGIVGLAACGGNFAEQEVPESQQKPLFGEDRLKSESVFGEEGLTVGSLRTPDQAGTAVNKHLWAAALDTLSFLPVASTDPFSGVIATDWGANPQAPSERFRVTAYFVQPDLAASSLKVAVFREVQNNAGAWVSAPVSTETPRKLEDAILVRARQMRIAEAEGNNAG